MNTKLKLILGATLLIALGLGLARCGASASSSGYTGSAAAVKF